MFLWKVVACRLVVTFQFYAAYISSLRYVLKLEHTADWLGCAEDLSSDKNIGSEGGVRLRTPQRTTNVPLFLNLDAGQPLLLPFMLRKEEKIGAHTA